MSPLKRRHGRSMSSVPADLPSLAQDIRLPYGTSGWTVNIRYMRRHPASIILISKAPRRSAGLPHTQNLAIPSDLRNGTSTGARKCFSMGAFIFYRRQAVELSPGFEGRSGAFNRPALPDALVTTAGFAATGPGRDPMRILRLELASGGRKCMDPEPGT